jgi:multicomponent Na+:H+ antiporter subunit G
MIEVVSIIGCFALVAGAVFVLLATIGVLRFPDLLTRMHSASKAGAVGGGLILLAVGLLSFDASVATRAIIGIGFLLLTTPLSAHLLARIAYNSPNPNFILKTDEFAAAEQSSELGKTNVN